MSDHSVVGKGNIFKSKKKIVLLSCLLAIILCLILSSIGVIKLFAVSGQIKITDVWMTTGLDSQGNPLPPVDTFKTNQPIIYCVVKLSAPKAINVGLRWYLEDQLIFEHQELAYQWRAFAVKPLPGHGFKEGNYRVEVYLVEKAISTVYFTITP